ncbi:hypothetical protein DNI29_04430 [Hymenobacter sediminis]|uniref:hypothetical protein n=1 Tax=Hymenobacter sediminis TaxID=2218621 RepID=UPI000DA6A3E3|nr:hypothetical protein [Hymenobacter sediminis]RPD50049.1 hypothetical protein DNI29_04430 [Hymenobacter sediminis]
MATPIEFPEQNWLLAKPADMTDEQCCSLPCFVDQTQVVSCWKLTEEELEEINRNGGKIYMGVYGASTPPIWLQPQNPFARPDEQAEVLGVSQAQ